MVGGSFSKELGATFGCFSLRQDEGSEFTCVFTVNNSCKTRGCSRSRASPVECATQPKKGFPQWEGGTFPDGLEVEVLVTD